MTNNAHFWRLTFDGAVFHLAQSTSLEGTAKQRVNEECVETILAHWGNQLLPGNPLVLTGRSAVLNAHADLTSYDRSGRSHLFEIKSNSPASAGEKELAQVLSYLIRDGQAPSVHQELLTQAAWFGVRTHAAYFGSLMVGQRMGTERPKSVAKAARYPMVTSARLAPIAVQASDRSGLAVNEATLQDLGRAAMLKELGFAHDEAVSDADVLWRSFLEARLWSGWRPTRRRITWIVAPDTSRARKAAGHLLARSVDLRFVDFEAREVSPGRAWSIKVVLHDADRLVAEEVAQAAMQRALEAHSMDSARQGQAAEISWSGDKGWFGWTGLAGPAGVELERTEAGVRWAWYSHWWTEGRALSLRNEINGMGQVLTKRGGHPAVLPAMDEGDGAAFVAALTALVDDAWLRLIEIGATSMSKYAYFEPAAG